MKKYPFSNTGVQEWMTDLYASCINTQHAEIDAIQEYLSDWLIMTFDLDENQQRYANELDSEIANSIQQALVTAINYHLPITLEKEQAPDPSAGAQEIFRVTTIKNSLQFQSIVGSGSGRLRASRGDTLTGELVIQVYYSSR